ncbi:imidazole glycerol phosphate synthase subunit HisH [Pontimonas sp.]|nr:imidazole glycerol phosphate synthase subunit HisH [Pontimonas sp.]MDA8909820.1 imidazole glycerol phosphate synthase subunit HisH [Pontimonas sp.]
MSPRVVVFDYGSGNVHSALKALEAAGAEVTLTNDATVAREAEGLVVPGVGAFATVMSALKAVGGDSLIEKRLAGSRPVLGICVGLQVMCEGGVEHGVSTEGLGQWPGIVEKLEAAILPHMGWNTVTPPHGSSLFRGVEDERFYFVHSYSLKSWSMEPSGTLPPPSVTWSHHGQDFVAAVENGPLSATQFHPEKSGPAGIHLLRNWVTSLAGA